MNLAELFVYGFGLWRICSIFARERGWFDVFVWFRETFIGIQHNQDSKTPVSYPDTNLGRLFECLWCLTAFAGIFLAIAIFLFGDPVFWIMLPFALSAIAILVESKT
jgi:hypothetical protein